MSAENGLVDFESFAAAADFEIGVVAVFPHSIWNISSCLVERSIILALGEQNCRGGK